MNIYKLKYFYDAALLGSVTMAAKKNFITQSAVSQAIKSIEEDIGTQLIIHKKNTFELTDEGKVVLESCKTVFGELDNLKTNALNVKNKVQGELRIAATNSIGLTFLAGKISSLAIKYPELKLILKLGNSDFVKDLLLQKEADIGFILEEDNMEQFDSLTIKKGKFLLVSKKIKLNDDPPEQLIISRKNKIEIRELQAEFQKKFKKQFDVQLEVFSWELIKQLCLNGVGTGFLPDYVVSEELKSNKLKSICTKINTFQYKLVALTVKGKVHSKNISTLLEECE